MKLTTTLLVAAAFSLTACGKGGGGGGGSNAANPSCIEKLDLFDENTANEVIIGDLQWQGTDGLSNAMVKANASATALIKIPAKSSRCTGFLINDNMIMTNHHCVSKASHARNLTATFGYTDKSKGKAFTCDQFVTANSGLDIGIIKCQGNPGKSLPKVVLADYQGEAKDKIYITHQNCNYKSNPSCKPTQKYSEGVVMRSNRSNIEHNADTLPGSSGSPIFDKASHKVMAIHNAGANFGPNNGGMNYGVPMSEIVDHLRTKHPEVKINASGDRKPMYQTCGE